MSLIASQHWKTSTKLWTNSLPVRPPGIMAYLLKSLSVQKKHSFKELHEILCQCWREGEVPHDMRDANIVTLYKNNGDRDDCNNYRGIFLLNIVGKLFAKVVLMKLRVLAERIYTESKCGFRAKRAIIYMIFSLRQLQEKCREQGKPLYVAFIDLTKAFDLVSRDGLLSSWPRSVVLLPYSAS